MNKGDVIEISWRNRDYGRQMDSGAGGPVWADTGLQGIDPSSIGNLDVERAFCDTAVPAVNKRYGISGSG